MEKEKKLYELYRHTHLEELSKSYSGCPFGFGFLDESFQKPHEKNEILPFLVSLPMGEGHVKIIWWFQKSEIDELLSPNSKQSFFDITALSSSFYTYFFDSDNRNHRSISQLVGSFLHLTKSKKMRSLAFMSVREWEAFLRERNSQTLGHELMRDMEDLKFSILRELCLKFLHYNQFTPVTHIETYAEKNLYFSKLLQLLLAFFGREEQSFRGVEAQADSEGASFFVAISKEIPSEEQAFFQSLFAENSQFLSTFPVKLVAVE